MGASAVVAVSGAAFTFYSRSRMNSEADNIHLDASNGHTSVGVTSDDCGKSDAELGLMPSSGEIVCDVFRKATRHEPLQDRLMNERDPTTIVSGQERARAV